MQWEFSLTQTNICWEREKRQLNVKHDIGDEQFVSDQVVGGHRGSIGCRVTQMSRIVMSVAQWQKEIRLERVELIESDVDQISQNSWTTD